MAKITSAPTPAKLASEWTKEFAKAVRSAAGKDGRLSLAEAKKLAPKLFADNAVNYLTRSGQKSISVDKLISAAHDYVEGAGKRAAGKNGIISLAEGNTLPADLKADFAYLRGKGIEELQTPTAFALPDMNGIILESSDGARSNLKPVYSAGTLAGAVTPAAVLELLKPQWSELKKNVWGTSPLDVNFAGLGDVTKLSAGAASEEVVTENQTESPEQLNALLAYLKANLKDVQVIEVSVPNASDSAVLVVGKTKDDHVAGFLAGRYVD